MPIYGSHAMGVWVAATLAIASDFCYQTTHGSINEVLDGVNIVKIPLYTDSQKLKASLLGNT